jgi:hypothetical protein
MSQKALLMKPQNIVIGLLIIAGGISLSAVAQWPAISEQQVAPAEFDFTVLHRQASDALDNLRRSQQRQAQMRTAVF